MPSTHTSLHTHVVFSTKDRRPSIDKAWRTRLHEYLGGLIRTAKAIPEAIGEKEFVWQQGYGAFSVSPTARDAVKTYIANQEEHHRTKTFQEEYMEFLQKSGVEYDERFLW